MIEKTKETTEQLALGAIGTSGIIGAWIFDIASYMQALTIIFSFFCIIIPTGIWACIRAFRAVRKLRSEVLNDKEKSK